MKKFLDNSTMTTHLKYKKTVGKIKLHENNGGNNMTKNIDEIKFHEGLVDLSNKSTGSTSGNNQQLELNADLTDSLNELSEIKDNLLKY